MQTVAHDSSFADITTTMRPGGSKGAVWTGRILSGLSAAFLIFDSIGKLLLVQPAVEGTTGLGYPVSVLVPIGVVELCCVLVYLIPRAQVPGAVLLTGYLGGAIATHVRVGNPLLSHVLFPIYVAALLWGGLLLRDPRLRAFLLPRRAK
jgi:DoxX-like protein